MTASNWGDERVDFPYKTDRMQSCKISVKSFQRSTNFDVSVAQAHQQSIISRPIRMVLAIVDRKTLPTQRRGAAFCGDGGGSSMGVGARSPSFLFYQRCSS